MNREPMTPPEFDANCREFERLCPWVSLTSGVRSIKRNEEVGGSKMSKHPLGMARDYVADTQAEIDSAGMEARRLGFWVTIHDVGSGSHVHIQGLAPGEPPDWWVLKYRS